MSPAYTVPLMETTYFGVGQVMTQNCSVEMVSNVDQLVVPAMFPTLLCLFLD